MLPPWHQSGLGKVQQIGKLTKSLKVVWSVAFNELSFDILSRQGAVPRLVIWSLVTLRNVVRPCQTKLHIYLFFSQSKIFLVISTISRTPAFHLNLIFFHDDLKESGARGGGGQTDCPKVNDSISPIKFRKKVRISLPKLSSVETVSRFPALFLKLILAGRNKFFLSRRDFQDRGKNSLVRFLKDAFICKRATLVRLFLKKSYYRQ